MVKRREGQKEKLQQEADEGEGSHSSPASWAVSGEPGPISEAASLASPDVIGFGGRYWHLSKDSFSCALCHTLPHAFCQL